MRGFDHNDVDKSRRKHILIVIKDFYAFEVFFGVLATFRQNVAHRRKLCTFYESAEFGEYLCVKRALFTDSYNAVPDFFLIHYSTSLSSFFKL